MYKIGIIGDRESVLGYMALGFTVHEADKASDAGKILRKLADSDEYSIIFITEQYAVEIEDIIERYKNNPLPAVICIPGKEGGIGYGMANVRNSVKRAVGADILFADDKK